MHIIGALSKFWQELCFYTLLVNLVTSTICHTLLGVIGTWLKATLPAMPGTYVCRPAH